VKHFDAQVVSVPWDFDDKLKEDRVSLTLLLPTAERLNSEEHLITFKVRLVCTITTIGLYNLANISGAVAALLLENITSDEICATPVLSKVEINMFPFAHGHQQSLMQQEYTSRLRG
jgi:UDP-N-acetylmuramyl tripeptide synthase